MQKLKSDDSAAQKNEIKSIEDSSMRRRSMTTKQPLTLQQIRSMKPIDEENESSSSMSES